MVGAGFGHHVQHAVDDITEQWIGHSFPSVPHAFAEANWQPDSSAVYCRRCGDSVGSGESTADGCGTCRTGAELDGGIGDGVLRLGPYTDELRLWVRAIKYHRWSEMGDELGRQLGLCVKDSGLIDATRAVVVPMPMPWQRRLYRGIDHTRIIAEGAACQLQMPVAGVLSRSMQPPQVTMIPSVRKRTGARGLHLKRKLWKASGTSLENLHVVLVDDVRTTGATLRAAVRLLKSLKPDRIVCAVLAVSESAARRSRSATRQFAGDVQSPA